MKPSFNYALGISIIFLLTGCDKLSSTETAGDKLDHATEKVDGALKKTGEVLSDTAITAKVKAAIMAEPDLKTLQMNVDTNDGIVKISGIVDSKEQSKRVSEIASSLSGIKDVHNDLSIKSPPQKVK
jgi:hyperosmotically inducible periplasmic protein